MQERYHEYILRREKELRESKQENIMPTYTLKDTKTNSTWDVMCSWDELQETLNAMPELVHVLGSISGSGTSKLLIYKGFLLVARIMQHIW